MALPETAGVPWRPRMDAGRLRMISRTWTVSTVVQAVPMLATAVLLLFPNNGKDEVKVLSKGEGVYVATVKRAVATEVAKATLGFAVTVAGVRKE